MLNSYRAVYRGQITKLCKSADEYLSSSISQPVEENRNNFDVVKEDLSVLLQRLSAAQDNLKRVNAEVEATVKSEDLMKECEAVVDQSSKKAESIEGFTPTESCYDGAIALLREEYLEKIVDKLMHQLMSLQAVSSRCDVSGLRHLYNTVVTCTRSLTALNVPAEHYSIMLKSILMRSMTCELRVDFHRLSSSQPETVDQDANASGGSASISTLLESVKDRLIQFIKTEVDSLEKPTSTSKPTARFSKPATAAGLMASTGLNSCVFCKSSGHETSKCTAKISIEQKRQILKVTGRCFKCSIKGHSAKFCRKSIKCEKCEGKHLTSLYDPRYKALHEKVNGQKGEPNKNDSENAINLCAAHKSTSNVYVQTANVFASPPNSTSSISLRVVLDGGSQVSFIRENISRKLGLPIIGQQHLSVIPFGSTKLTPPTKCNRVRMCLRSQHIDKFAILEAVEVPSICLDVLAVPKSHDPAFEKFVLADTRRPDIQLEEGISILIGVDSYWNVVSGEYERITSNLTAINTLFGWTLQGPVYLSSGTNTAEITSLSVTLADNDELRKFWDLETVGIRSNELSVLKRFKDFDKTHINYRGRYYEVSLPWKESSVSLNDNKMNALMRLKSLTRVLSRDQVKLKEYDEIIRNYIREGFAEVVPTKYSNGRVYYMPHRAVYRDYKVTTKVRVVFDASSHEKGYSSLNDQLWIGDKFNTDLLPILLRFRLAKFAMTADVEKAFLQIHLNERDRDSHRFLWYAHPASIGQETSPIIEYRMTRVTFGVSSSPFLLASVIRQHLTKFQENSYDNCKLLEKSFYIDDPVVSVDDLVSAEKLFREATNIMSSAGMNLRKWNTNNATLRDVFEPEGKIENPTYIQSLLVLRWYTNSDEIAVKLNFAIDFSMQNSKGTKREVLQLLSRTYDPLGFLGLFTVRLKILLQDAWKLNLDWDEVLPKSLLKAYLAWCLELMQLELFVLPRHILSQVSNSEGNLELHVFADASKRAYGTVAYIRRRNNETVNTNMICSKNRLAPLKGNGTEELTVPRLELTAALLAARLKTYLVQHLSLKFNNIYLWSDSRIGLHWIAGYLNRWEPYVKNRVREIRELTGETLWMHCSGNSNPADLLTRELRTDKFLQSTLWLNGPTWLQDPDATWSSEISSNSTLLITTPDTIRTSPAEGNSLISTQLLPSENFSSMHKLLRVTAYVLRFIRNVRTNEGIHGSLITSEIEYAELYWIKYTQRLEYENEIMTLSKGEVLLKSHIITLSPFIDANGVMRVGGRLQMADLHPNTIHPAILPKNSSFTQHIVNDAHSKTFHGGVNAVLAYVRQKFCVIKGRQLIKSVISSCVICKRLRGKAMSQPFPPLPRERIIKARPFEITGVDFAGPLCIKKSDANDEHKKVYIMLLTCGVIRAVHLEIVPNLTTESCINALRRFVARRGVPKTFYSDNAKTFKRAAVELNELGKLVNSTTLHDFVVQQGADWNFIVERATWWGGWWERLIRTVKDALKATLGRSVLNIDQLQTILTEVEFTINSRPLTYISNDIRDLEPLTPSHILMGNTPNTLPSLDAKYSKICMNVNIRNQWKHRQALAKKFWVRWTTEYLQQLKTAHYSPTTHSSSMNVGDVILLFEKGSPRILWKLAIIEAIFPGRDGKIRACEIRLPNGTKLRRPVQHLYPLEINSHSGPEDEENKNLTNEIRT